MASRNPGKGIARATGVGFAGGALIGGATAKDYSTQRLNSQVVPDPENPVDNIVSQSIEHVATGATPVDTLMSMGDAGVKGGLLLGGIAATANAVSYARTAYRASQGRKAHMNDAANKARR